MKGTGVYLDNHRGHTRWERMPYQKDTEILKNEPQIYVASEKCQTQKTGMGWLLYSTYLQKQIYRLRNEIKSCLELGLEWD